MEGFELMMGGVLRVGKYLLKLSLSISSGSDTSILQPLKSISAKGLLL